jgi:hypothetical protein
MSLAHGRLPEVLLSPEHLEAILRTLVTGVLGAALIFVLREPEPEPHRVRNDEIQDR